MRKTFFYIHTNIVQKKYWEKKARNNFSGSIRIMRAINVGKKSSEKVTKNVFLYSHEYRDQKMGGQNERNNFSRNTRIVGAKNGKNIVWKKCAKRFFIFTRISWPKKNARNTFFRNTRIVRAKMLGKNILWIKCEKTFFIYTRISWPKNGGTKWAKQFFQLHTNSASKKCWKKNCLIKVRKMFLYIHTNIVTIIWGEKTGETIFPEKHE